MRLPKFAARWVDKQVQISEDAHSAHCLAHGVDADDIDPPESWRENLRIWFPLEIAGGSWQRPIDWGEIWATFWIPAHKNLLLCKIGWHHWSMVYRWAPRYTQCGSCGKRDYTFIPRWAR